MVNEWSGKIILGIGQVQIIAFSIDTNGTLFFINGNNIRNPSGIRDGVYETYFAQFLDLSLYGRSFCGVNGSLILVNRCNIRPCFNTMFDDGWIKPRNIDIGPRENTMELLKKIFLGIHLFQGARGSKCNVLNFLRLLDILTQIVGEMLAILPFSKKSSAGMGFFNQLTLPWMKYLASMEY